MKKAKLTAALLAAAMTVSMAGCGSAASSTAASEATSEAASESAAESVAEPTATPEPTEEPTPTPVPTPERVTPAWVTSHDSADFNFDDLMYVNSTSYQIAPGDGQSFYVSMCRYNYETDANGKATGTVFPGPYYDVGIYTWYDTDGTLHWYLYSPINCMLLVDDPNGNCANLYTLRYDGETTRGYYPTSEAVAHIMDYNGKNAFLVDYSSVGPIEKIDRSEDPVFYEERKLDLDGSTYKTTVSGDGVKTMDVYLDDDMNIVSMMYQVTDGAKNELGFYPVTETYWQDIKGKLPNTADVTDAFNAHDKVTCTIVTDDKTYEMPMDVGCTSYMSTFDDAQTIEVSPAVEAFDNDGNSQGMKTELADGEYFILTEPVTFTIH